MVKIDASKIKTSQIRAFIAVATYGSFSRASVELGINQSSVSHSISALEEILGVSLLFRSHTGALLTPIGERLLSDAQLAMTAIGQMATKSEESRGLNSGQVRVGCIRSLGVHWLPQVVAAFKHQYPKVSITINKYYDCQEVQRCLRAQHIDIGLMDLYDNDGLTSHLICRDDYVAIVPLSVFEDDKVTWQQLADHPLIMPAPDDEGYSALRRYVQQADVKIKVSYEINEDAAIVGMVAQGLGVAILPRLAVYPIPDRVKLCELPTPLYRDLVAAILADALHSPAVFSFMHVARHQVFKSVT